MTIPAELLRKYRAERAKGTIAFFAYNTAKAAARPFEHAFLAKLDIDSPVEGEIGPFTVRVKVVPDEDGRLGDDDVSGTFTDTKDEYTIPNTVAPNWDVNGVGYKFYRPSSYTRKHAYADYRKAGMSKAAAHEAYAKRVQDEMHDDAHRHYYGVVVTVGVAGRKLAEDSLWWIDTLEDDPNTARYFIEVAGELIDQAIGDARDNIPALIAAETDLLDTLLAASNWTPEAQS